MPRRADSQPITQTAVFRHEISPNGDRHRWLGVLGDLASTRPRRSVPSAGHDLPTGSWVGSCLEPSRCCRLCANIPRKCKTPLFLPPTSRCMMEGEEGARRHANPGLSPTCDQRLMTQSTSLIIIIKPKKKKQRDFDLYCVADSSIPELCS